MTEMDRVYHPYYEWEDFKFGMYEKTCFMDEMSLIVDCELLLKTPEWLWEAMQFVSHNWIFSSENHLTNKNRNRQAWLGQAACCFVHGAPEYITKLAWHRIGEKHQAEANAVADEVISEWENKYLTGYFDRIWNGKNRNGKKCIRCV